MEWLRKEFSKTVHKFSLKAMMFNKFSHKAIRQFDKISMYSEGIDLECHMYIRAYHRVMSSTST